MNPSRCVVNSCPAVRAAHQLMTKSNRDGIRKRKGKKFFVFLPALPVPILSDIRLSTSKSTQKKKRKKGDCNPCENTHSHKNDGLKPVKKSIAPLPSFHYSEQIGTCHHRTRSFHQFMAAATTRFSLFRDSCRFLCFELNRRLLLNPFQRRDALVTSPRVDTLVGRGNTSQ